jgi:hypothetical protein
MRRADQVLPEARALLQKARLADEIGDLAAFTRLLRELRDLREYPMLMDLAELAGRIAPGHAESRRLYVQALIETGRATVALDVLAALKTRLKEDDAEMLEVLGLMGRAHKQVYVDARVRGEPYAQRALADSIAAYRSGFEKNKGQNTYHGVNLLAMVAHCRRVGLPCPAEYPPKGLAADLLTVLDATPPADRDVWHQAKRAEAALGTENWDSIAATLRDYTNHPDFTEFHLRSTLRQFAEVWQLDHTPAGKELLTILQAHMASLPGGEVQVPAELLSQKSPDKAQFEALLGEREGTRTYDWWNNGLRQGRGVAAIRQKNGGRVGTGFLVRASDLKPGLGEGFLVLTNFHVVNTQGLADGLMPEDVEVAFEASDTDARYEIDAILWESHRDEFDAAVLRLKGVPPDARPLDLARNLPLIGDGKSTQVFVIGHPLGNELTYSFQDNVLIDHEGPPKGAPQIPGVCRVQYRAQTEKGNSGSPVFNVMWKVIALHHKGGKEGMPRLNGVAGTHGANEGISIQSIIERMKLLN